MSPPLPPGVSSSLCSGEGGCSLGSGDSLAGGSGSRTGKERENSVGPEGWGTGGWGPAGWRTGGLSWNCTPGGLAFLISTFLSFSRKG